MYSVENEPKLSQNSYSLLNSEVNQYIQQIPILEFFIWIALEVTCVFTFVQTIMYHTNRKDQYILTQNKGVKL